MDYGASLGSNNPLEKLNATNRDNNNVYINLNTVNQSSPSQEESRHDRPTVKQMLQYDFYKRPVHSWFAELCEGLFKVHIRGSTIQAEIYYGLIHYISCFYCLAVIPTVMSDYGYEPGPLFLTTAITSGLGCIFGGVLVNLPFPFAPPTVVAIFLGSFLKNFANSSPIVGSAAVVLSGAIISVLSYRPLSTFIGRLIPSSIQVGTSIGIGLLTALAGAVEVKLVEKGTDGALLKMGSLTLEVYICIFGIALICILTHYHINGPFAIGILSCSFLWWTFSHEWPEGVFGLDPIIVFNSSKYYKAFNDPKLLELVVDLLLLYILYLNGLTSSLSRLADLTQENGGIPRGRWIYVVVGIVTVVSGFFTGVPILISPEGAAAIKEGAKTGLSTTVCGVLFLFSCFFAPVFQAIPAAGSSPILIMVGALLFQNVSRIDWKSLKESAPAFVVLFFIPFSFSLIKGVLLGYVVYILINLCTGDLFYNSLLLLEIYFPVSYDKFITNLIYIAQHTPYGGGSSGGGYFNNSGANDNLYTRKDDVDSNDKSLLVINPTADDALLINTEISNLISDHYGSNNRDNSSSHSNRSSRPNSMKFSADGNRSSSSERVGDRRGLRFSTGSNYSNNENDYNNNENDYNNNNNNNNNNNTLDENHLKLNNAEDVGVNDDINTNSNDFYDNDGDDDGGESESGSGSSTNRRDISNSAISGISSHNTGATATTGVSGRIGGEGIRSSGYMNRTDSANQLLLNNSNSKHTATSQSQAQSLLSSSSSLSQRPSLGSRTLSSRLSIQILDGVSATYAAMSRARARTMSTAQDHYMMGFDGDETYAPSPRARRDTAALGTSTTVAGAGMSNSARAFDESA